MSQIHDSKAMELSQQVMRLFFSPMPGVQLQAKIQCLFADAMAFAAGNSPAIPDGYVMVPKEPTEEMLQASYREASVYSPTAYRAMIAAAPQSPGSEPATVPGKWILVSERMPESNKFVLVSNGVWVGQGLYDDSEHLESDEHWQDEHREFINVLHHPVTHWMPLPAAPQEPKP